MSPKLRRLFHEYAAYHANPINVAIHKVCVPAILFHVVAMLDWVTLLDPWVGQRLTLGMAACVLAGAWYLAMSPRYAAVVVPFAIVCLWVGRWTPGIVVIAVAVLAWAAQLVGHTRFEHRAPAFRDNLVQLLVGPAYVVALMLGDWPEQEDQRSQPVQD